MYLYLILNDGGQVDNASLDVEEPGTVASGAAECTPVPGKPVTFTTSVRQIFVSTWTLVCFVGMVVIAGSFIVQRISDEARMLAVGAGTRTLYSYYSHRSQPLPPLYDPSTGRPLPRETYTSQNVATSSMTKDVAMVLTFLYACFAWTLSNGLVLNPRHVKL